MVTVAKSPMMEGGGREGREVQERREAKARLCFRKCQKKKKSGFEADTTW